MKVCEGTERAKLTPAIESIGGPYRVFDDTIPNPAVVVETPVILQLTVGEMTKNPAPSLYCDPENVLNDCADDFHPWERPSTIVTFPVYACEGTCRTKLTPARLSIGRTYGVLDETMENPAVVVVTSVTWQPTWGEITKNPAVSWYCEPANVLKGIDDGGEAPHGPPFELGENDMFWARTFTLGLR